MKKLFYIFLLSALVLSSCVGNKHQDNDIENLFSSLEDSGYHMPSTGMYNIPYDSLRKGITMLQAYKNGKLEEYPSNDVNRTLEEMIWGAQDCLLPSRTSLGDSLEYYMETFMERAYELCPDVGLITDVVSDDSCWGIRIYTRPMNSYIFYKDNHGKKRIMKTDKIAFYIKPIRKNGINKYVCSVKKSGSIAGEDENIIGNIYFSPFGFFDMDYCKLK